MGIEYDFGRVKWYYKDHHTFSMDRLQNGSMAAFVATVVTLGHTRKFARKARDYMRAYRVSATGLDADSAARVMKSHRCMLDVGEVFCAADAQLSSVKYLSVANGQTGVP